MTAEQALHESLWYRLPTYIKSHIDITVKRGSTKADIPDEALRNVDIMEMNGILRYLGYDIARKKNGDWIISWDAGYRNRY